MSNNKTKHKTLEKARQTWKRGYQYRLDSISAGSHVVDSLLFYQTKVMSGRKRGPYRQYLGQDEPFQS